MDETKTRKRRENGATRIMTVDDIGMNCGLNAESKKMAGGTDEGNALQRREASCIYSDRLTACAGCVKKVRVPKLQVFLLIRERT